MMAEPYCDLMDLPASTCAHCTGAKAPEEAAEKAPTLTTEIRGGFRRLASTGSKVAEFHTRCPAGCGDPIEPGDNIKQDASGDWVHEECL